MEQFDSMLSPIIDQTLRSEMPQYHRIPVQRNYSFAYERLFLWRLMHRRCHLSSDVPSLASSDTGKTYNFSTADKLNTLLLNCLLSIRQLKISVPAKWVRTSRQYMLNIYSCNNAYADVFLNDFG